MFECELVHGIVLSTWIDIVSAVVVLFVKGCSVVRKLFVLAGEEAGPRSNKMGGIWNVIDSELRGMRCLVQGESEYTVVCAGPFYAAPGADWNGSLNRVTDVGGLEERIPPGLEDVVSLLAQRRIRVKGFCDRSGEVDVNYLLFDTSNFEFIPAEAGQTTLANAIKQEAYYLAGLNSLEFEKTGYGVEYSHYLYLSYAISEFLRVVCELGVFDGVSLHLHEFGVFYTGLRVKKLGLPVKVVATFHATKPGRTCGYRVIEKLCSNDPHLDENNPLGLVALEALSKHADVITFVSESTRREARLFYGVDGLVVRNGIDVVGPPSAEKKSTSRRHIQEYLSDAMHACFNGVPLPPESLVPFFTVSRIELENKGYPDLLDSLIILDRILKSHIRSGTLDEDVRAVCFLVTAHGPKDPEGLPEYFPVNLPREVLVGEEHRLASMIQERGLGVEGLVGGRRVVSALLYPQWMRGGDGGLSLELDEFMAGSVFGIFPSRYDPFLLTGLEAGREGTPSIVSRVCGFSDALSGVKRLSHGMGGFVVVDNMELSRQEYLVDYALAMEYFTLAYLQDKSKYGLLCGEAFSVASQMGWDEPVRKYFELMN